MAIIGLGIFGVILVFVLVLNLIFPPIIIQITGISPSEFPQKLKTACFFAVPIVFIVLKILSLIPSPDFTYHYYSSGGIYNYGVAIERFLSDKYEPKKKFFRTFD